MPVCDTRNFDNIEIEKKLPDAVKRLAYGPIAFWSIVRIKVLNHIGTRIDAISTPSQNGLIGARASVQARRVVREIFYWLSFVSTILMSRGCGVIIRVSSFSIAGENEGKLQFVNGNLQEVYDQFWGDKTKVLVVVNDQAKYKLRHELTSATVCPASLSILAEEMALLLRRPAVSRLVATFCEYLPVSRQYARKLIAREIGNISLWSTLYKYMNPQRVYYDCPHNSFEGEVAAAKINGVKTIEMYHGGITPDEPSYSHRHLDFSGLIHAICDEFLSPSEKQTEFLLAISDKYKAVTTIRCKPSPSLSALQASDLAGAPTTRAGTKRLLFVTSITDHDIFDVKAYLEKNLQDLLRTFDSIVIRLHPEDSKERWRPLLDAYQFIEVSQLSLSEDIASAAVLVVVSPTIMLQLRALNIEFVDLSRSAI